jgi:hypothetical protein
VFRDDSGVILQTDGMLQGEKPIDRSITGFVFLEKGRKQKSMQRSKTIEDAEIFKNNCG